MSPPFAPGKEVTSLPPGPRVRKSAAEVPLVKQGPELLRLDLLGRFLRPAAEGLPERVETGVFEWPFLPVHGEERPSFPFRHLTDVRRLDALLPKRGQEPPRVVRADGGDQGSLGDRDVRVDPHVVPHGPDLGP